MKISALGLDANQGYEVAEIWSNKKMGRLAPSKKSPPNMQTNVVGVRILDKNEKYRIFKG